MFWLKSGVWVRPQGYLRKHGGDYKHWMAQNGGVCGEPLHSGIPFADKREHKTTKKLRGNKDMPAPQQVFLILELLPNRLLSSCGGYPEKVGLGYRVKLCEHNCAIHQIAGDSYARLLIWDLGLT